MKKNILILSLACAMLAGCTSQQRKPWPMTTSALKYHGARSARLAVTTSTTIPISP